MGSRLETLWFSSWALRGGLGWAGNSVGLFVGRVDVEEEEDEDKDEDKDDDEEEEDEDDEDED